MPDHVHLLVGVDPQFGIHLGRQRLEGVVHPTQPEGLDFFEDSDDQAPEAKTVRAVRGVGASRPARFLLRASKSRSEMKGYPLSSRLAPRSKASEETNTE